TIRASGYFNDRAVDILQGDLIIVSSDVDGTPATDVLVVTSADGAATVTTQGLATVTQTFNARYALTVEIALTDGVSGHVVAPFAGDISTIETVLTGGAVTTNDAVCTFDIGGTGITDGVVTIANSGSAIGDLDSATPSALNTVAAGDLIKCTVSGSPGGSRTAYVTILVDAAT
ncbi:hypothetical protein KAR91_54470, partial [Candidatus Pacearchaeota archaeon]|nr:hypothetical protein [Candidatus Pacearchaeota archaeon]